MQNAVNVIIDKANEIKSKANERKLLEMKKVQSVYDEAIKEYKTLMTAAKQLCTHPVKRKKFYENRYKGESGYHIYCGICNKYLGNE